jgi:2-oxoglutarate ferredoxin oxidoreductase subunit gamma
MVSEVRTDAPERHVAVPATQLPKERFGKELFANMIMLGALTRLSGMDYAAMKQAMLEIIPRFHEQNLAALEAGHTLATLAPA